MNKYYKLFVRIQLLLVTGTLCCGLLAYLIPYLTGHDHLLGFVPLFDVGKETSFPTYISGINLLVAAVICSSMYKLSQQLGDNPTRYWLVLAPIFVYLSIDESVMIHERLGALRPLFFDFSLISGRHSWLFAGTALAVILGAIVAPFLRLLPRRMAVLFVISGLIFGLGAIGMEFVGSVMIDAGISPSDFSYQVRRLVEEALEMYGIVMFNCVAAGQLASQIARLRIVASDKVY